MFEGHFINQQCFISLHAKVNAFIQLLINFGQKRNFIQKGRMRRNDLDVNIPATRLVIEA